MKLYLAVPRQTRQADDTVAAVSTQTYDWFARLPLLETPESLQQVHDALYRINRTAMAVADRTRTVDMFRSPLRIIRGQVEAQLARGALPLSSPDLRTAELFRACCIEMAYAYKAVALELARTARRRRYDELRLSLARALFYLEQTVFAGAVYRQKTPPGSWQEIHAVYFYARSLGLTESSVKDPSVKAGTATTISLLYRRVLLFGLSDPSRQSVPLMCRLLEFLRQHAQRTDLRRYSSPPTERCQFVIDPQSDYPAQAHHRQSSRPPPTDALLLDTVELTRNAHDQLNHLTSTNSELDEEFQDILGRSLLEAVVYAWGISPWRREERLAVERTRVTAGLGINAVNLCRNGNKPFELSAPGRENGHPAPLAASPRRDAAEPDDVNRLACHVVDRSQSGVSLSVPYDAPETGSLTVGEVIACRQADGGWIPGLIRWLHCVEGTIHFGVEHFQDATRPVAVKAASARHDEPFKVALAVYLDAEEGPSLRLIAPTGLYRYRRNLLVDDGDRLLMTQCRTLIERNPAMEYFDCEHVAHDSATPEASLYP